MNLCFRRFLLLEDKDSSALWRRTVEETDDAKLISERAKGYFEQGYN